MTSSAQKNRRPKRPKRPCLWRHRTRGSMRCARRVRAAISVFQAVGTIWVGWAGSGPRSGPGRDQVGTSWGRWVWCVREKMWCWSTAPLGTQFGKSSVRTPCLPHSATIRRGRLVHTDYVCACYNCVRLKEHPRKPADPSLFCRQRTVSKRKRLAVSTFLRSRRWRWRPSAGATSRPSRARS